MPRAVEDFFGAHLEDHVGVRAAQGPCLATSRSKSSSTARVLPLCSGSTQTSTPVDGKELRANLAREGLVENGRLGLEPSAASSSKIR
jgi:hypothetical protein